MGFCCNGLGWGGWMPWGGTWVGLVLNLVLSVGVLSVLGLGTAWLVRKFSRRPAAPETGEVPLEIARRRLAAGEITVAEFEGIRDRVQS
jgi:uncharacterized membrane protein